MNENMNVLSLIGFRAICKEFAPALFVFDTDNQLNGISQDIKIVEKYSEVIIMLNPNRICFKSETGTLCLNRVKFIRQHEHCDMVGEVFSIVCGNKKDENDDISYTIIVDKK